jgi:hypothetical protein
MRKEQPFPDGDEPQAVGPNGAYATAGSSDYLIGFERAGRMRIGSTWNVAWPIPKRSFNLAQRSTRNESSGWPPGITKCAVSAVSVVLIDQM